MFELYQFNPETFKSEGFKLISSHETAQECHDKASLDGIQFYVVEKKETNFSRRIFMSELPKPPEPEVISEQEIIPETEVIPEPVPEQEVIPEPEVIPEVVIDPEIIEGE